MSNRTKINYRKIAEEHYGVSVSGMHVHHKDGNCHNNSPENLVICTPQEHADYHRELGQETIALLIEGQSDVQNWFSVIGKIGAEKSKGVPRNTYIMSVEALKQRSDARNCKGDPLNTKLCLRGESRTENQKIGKLKETETRRSRGRNSTEVQQFEEFRKLGIEAAKQSLSGSKKLFHPVDKTIKFAKPNSDKWMYLLNNGYIVN